MKKKSNKHFTASNGIKVEYAPELAAAKPLTDAEWKNMKRVNAKDILSVAEMQAMSEVMVKKLRGRPRKAAPKINTTLRLSRDVADAIRGSGAGYSARVEQVLRDAIADGRI